MFSPIRHRGNCGKSQPGFYVPGSGSCFCDAWGHGRQPMVTAREDTPGDYCHIPGPPKPSGPHCQSAMVGLLAPARFQELNYFCHMQWPRHRDSRYAGTGSPESEIAAIFTAKDETRSL